MSFNTRAIVKTACLALTLSMTTATVFTVSADPAFAERGGNGNGGGNKGERGNNRSANAERGAAGNNGRGHLARELRGLNAAHANANALANAAPNSMPGKLNTYRLAQESFSGVIAIQDEKYAEYQRLIGLTEEEINTEFPEGGYEDAVTNAAIAYEIAQGNALEAQTTADESLSILTGGRELSDEALAELWRLLNL